MKRPLFFFLVIGVVSLIIAFNPSIITTVLTGIGGFFLVSGAILLVVLPIAPFGIFFQEEFVYKNDKKLFSKGLLRKLIVISLCIFYAKIGLDIFYDPYNSAISSIAISSSGTNEALKEIIIVGAKLIYPLSWALIIVCFEEKDLLWIPKLDPSCFKSNSDNFLPVWILILLPICTCYVFIPVMSLGSYISGIDWLFNLVRSFF